MKTNSFSQVVSGAEPVSNAFAEFGGVRLWWRLILWLHGKPTSPSLSDAQRRHIVADGFQFYAGLYRLLGVLFWLVGVAIWCVGVFESQRDAFYWLTATMLSGGFLWFASGLGFSGARTLRQQKSGARPTLCAFMVAIIAFLSALTTALSVVVHFHSFLAPTWNLLVLALLWVIGLGSYLIEILYLVGETRLDA